MQGVIAAGHPQTAQAGAEILWQGGNAIDAAVAATFASFVTESALVNIGGGGIAQIFDPATGHAVVYDFFSNMPGLSSDRYNGSQLTGEIDFRKILIDFGAAQQPFYIGRGSVAVPGVVAGLCQLVADAGRLSLAEVLAPATRLAREGVIVTKAQEYVMYLLTPILTDTPSIAAVYTRDDRMIRAGETLHFPNLAGTLERLSQEGAGLFYHGHVAQQVLADQTAHGGLITQADLEHYAVHKCGPITVDYRGYEILLPPPASSGGVLIAFALKLLNHVSLADIAPNSFEHLRILTEVMRLTNLARADWEANIDQAPAMIDEHVRHLLAKTHIAHYRHKLDEILANRQRLPDAVAPQGPSNTTHLSVADLDGVVASITTSAGECSGFMVGNTGIKLNNMLGEIDLHRNGFHQLPAGQRLMTMMSPALVLREGRPILAVGSGGSNRLRSAILQVISNFIDFRMHLAEAVDAPRLHFEDDHLQLEGGMPAETADKLEAAGYQVNRWPERNMFFGGAHAVAREDPASPIWVAAGDRRRGGSTVIID